jgi:hypothetical protein
MAKRNADKKRRIETVETGIYFHWTINGVAEDGLFDDRPDHPTIDFIHELEEALRVYGNCARGKLRGRLIELPGEIAAVVPRRKTLDLGDGPKIYAIPTGLPRDVYSAVDLLEWIKMVQQSVASGVPARDLYIAFRAGEAAEMSYVLPHEPDAKRGKTVQRGAAIGGRTRRKLDDQAATEAKAERDRLISLGHSHSDACNLVAESIGGVSGKTISRL